LTAPGVTLAADYCAGPWAFFTQFSFMLAGKRFKAPAPGQCQQFNGFLESVGEFNTSTYVVTGSACTAFTGLLTINGMYNAGGAPSSVVVNINTATGSGTGTDCRMDVGNGGGCVTIPTFHAEACRFDYPG